MTPSRRTDPVAAIGALADPTRRALYDAVVAAREPVSREQAARAAGVPVHRAKFHLDRLEAEGLLRSSYARTTGRTGPGAGRPAKFFRRAEQELAVSFPARGYELVGRLFAAGVASSERTGEPVRDCLERTFAAAGRAHGREAPGPGDALERTARVLADLGYEPHRALDRLELENCPFHALAQDETELVCGLNHCFVSGLAEETAPGELDARLEPDPQRCCVVVHRTSG